MHNIYRINVGQAGLDSEADRQRLAADLEHQILISGLDLVSVKRESQRPGETMAAGTIISIEAAGRIGRQLLEAIRAWLASRRTEVELQTPEGKRIKVSAANFEEAIQLLDQLRDHN